MTQLVAKRIQAYLTAVQGEMVVLLQQLVLAESPSSVPDSQAQVQSILLEALQAIDYEVQPIPGRETGGQLHAQPRLRSPTAPEQLLLGHCDTVWPIGTLKEMPFVVRNNVIRGPGVYDMKAGLTQMIFALRTLRELNLRPQVSPIVFINSDEEIGSKESDSRIRALARQANRVFVLEPSLGLSGKLKTARKGVGRFKVVVTGRAAHAGLDPEKGISAVLELSHLIQKLFAMNDLERGVTVNVGTIEGGLRPNVVAPRSSAVVDVRVPSLEDAQDIEQAILSLDTVTPGTSVQVSGRISRPPLEKTPANRRLWEVAKGLGTSIDLQLEEGMAGGGSDGNTTSQYTATLDGLGAVGDGAHAQHEFVYLDKMLERSALLALLLMAPPIPE